MVDSRLVDYIKRGLAEGCRIEHMESALIREGWKRKEIDEAIDAILDERDKAHLVGTQAEPLVYMTKVPELVGEEPPPEPPDRELPETGPEPQGTEPEKPPEPAAEPGAAGKTMGVFTRFRMVLRHPGKFFHTVKAEKGYETPVKYYLFLLFIQIIIANMVLLISLTIGSAFFDPSLINPLMGIFALTTVNFLFANLYIVLTIVLLFVMAWFFNIFLRLFGGRGRMADTFKGIVYSYTPNVILTMISIPIMILAFYSLIPPLPAATLYINPLEASAEILLSVLSLVFLIWMAYLELRGLSVFHEISMPRVLTALIVAFAVLWIIINVLLNAVFISSLLPSLIFY